MVKSTPSHAFASSASIRSQQRSTYQVNQTDRLWEIGDVANVLEDWENNTR